ILVAGRVGGHADFFRLHTGTFDQGRDIPTSAIQIELPTVVATLQPYTVKTAKRQRHSTVRTNIPQRCYPSLTVPTNNQGKPQQSLGLHTTWSYLLRAPSRIPKTQQGCALGCLRRCVHALSTHVSRMAKAVKLLQHSP